MSLAELDSEIAPLTGAVLATESMTGQTLRLPLIRMLPRFFGRWQVRWTVTSWVVRATTAKFAEPTQLMPASALLADSVIVYPVPAGRPPIVAVFTVEVGTAIQASPAKPAGPSV